MNIKKSLAISETGFLFDPSTGDSFTVNPTGLKIIQLLKEGKSLQAITEFMVGEYDIDPQTFERYFYDFSGMLKQMQLVTNIE